MRSDNNGPRRQDEYREGRDLISSSSISKREEEAERREGEVREREICRRWNGHVKTFALPKGLGCKRQSHIRD